MQHTISMKENHLFRRAYAKGKSAAGPALVLYARRNGRKGNRLGLTVSTKVGKAVARNKVRRRMREIYRLHEGELKRGFDLVLVARVRAADSRYKDLERQFLKLCGRLDLARNGGGAS